MTPPSTPKVLKRTSVFSTPWINVIEKEVELRPGKVEKFYALSQSIYVAIYARTPSGRIPLIRQYRPAVEAMTLEIPAGTVDKDETPEAACIRETIEETGHRPTRVVFLGEFYPDTGRLMNPQHAFFVEIEEEPSSKVEEEGLSLEYHTRDSLERLIRTGEFRHLLHVSVVLLAHGRPDLIRRSS